MQLFFSRLLFWILVVERCQEQMDWLMVGEFCSRIYEEAKFVSRWIDRVPEFKDLLMEQVFLCGFLGFSEFFKVQWIQQILSWQNLEIGCFSYKDNQCQNHISGNFRYKILVIQKSPKNQPGNPGNNPI